MNEQTSSHASPASDLPRRGFLYRFFAGAVGAIAGLVPLLTGGIFFLDPLLRKNTDESSEPGQGVVKDPDGFIKLNVTAETLPADGTPQLFKVYDDVVDAWNKFLNIEIGSVWLRRQPDGTVIAFSSICPHLGCAVDYRGTDRDFYCPCHTSAFDLDGEKKNQIPPRGMDTLEIKVKSDNFVWLKYEAFRATTPEKVLIS